MKKALNSVAKENTVKESPSPVESASTKPAAQLQGVPQSLLEKVRTSLNFLTSTCGHRSRQDEEIDPIDIFVIKQNLCL